MGHIMRLFNDQGCFDLEQCRALTKNGERCKNHTLRPTKERPVIGFCKSHFESHKHIKLGVICNGIEL